MAVTKLWKVSVRLGQVLDYTTNPEKTANPEYSAEDYQALKDVLAYAKDDEPTGALDKKTGTQIMELLHSVVKENGIMLLLVTHDPDIADTCDTIFEMDGGRITCAKNDT